MKKIRIKKIASLFLSLIMVMGFTLNSWATGIDTSENIQDTSDNIISNRTLDFDSDDLETTIDVSSLRRARTLWVDSELQGYLTAQGQTASTGAIAIYSGEILQVKMTQPNDSSIDYDLYLYDCDSNGNLISLVDVSTYATRNNTGYGTMPEAVGAYNNSSATKYYRIVVLAYSGSSSTIPFTLRVGIADTTDPNEAKQNVWNLQQRIQLNTQSATSVTAGRMITYSDNDWFVASVPTSANYSQVLVTLDDASVAAGYRVQVVTFSGGLQAALQNQPYTATKGQDFYVRVFSESATSLLSSAYTITFTPITSTPTNPPGTGTNYFSRSSGTMNAILGGFSSQWPASSGTVLGTNPQVTSVTVRLVVSSGSSPVYLWVENPANPGSSATLVYKGTYGVGTHNITLTEFNGKNPKGTWYMWIETTGAVSTATSTITVNYKY